jgi:hypothetical protein
VVTLLWVFRGTMNKMREEIVTLAILFFLVTQPFELYGVFDYSVYSKYYFKNM